MDTQTMNIIAVVVGPIIAILITLIYQGQKEKRDAKVRLFQLLMAHRKSNPPTLALVQGLNLIDVVFSEHREIVSLWHEYFDLLCQRPLNLQLIDPKYLDLLASMASVLGYKNLLQTDISRFYNPEAHGEQAVLENDIQKELLRVLRNTASFVVTEKKDNK